MERACKWGVGEWWSGVGDKERDRNANAASV